MVPWFFSPWVTVGPVPFHLTYRVTWLPSYTYVAGLTRPWGTSSSVQIVLLNGVVSMERLRCVGITLLALIAPFKVIVRVEFSRQGGTRFPVCFALSKVIGTMEL